MEPITVYIGAGSVPVIAVIVQLAKGFIQDARYYMPIAVLAGILINAGIALVTGAFTPEIILNAVLVGIMAGGSASGFYSGGKEIASK
jgi:hypothetical protein